MHTGRVSALELDQEKLRSEMELTRTFRFTEAYQEFVSGKLSKDVMLWTPGGVSGDGIIAHYDQSLEPRITEYGERLPYLMQTVEENFATEHIRFARLAVLSEMVHIPHRDYVEFAGAASQATPAHRLHLPIITNPSCLFSEDNTVYRMKVGEVWFLDASREHGSAALSAETRIHLIVDFTDEAGDTGLVRGAGEEPVSIPQSHLVHREPLSDEERAGLYSLASIVDRDNLKDVLGIIAKKHYRRDGGDGFFWNTVDALVERIPDRELAKHVAGLREYFLLDRTE
ncbi:aspartyl/asparaginyl beta-hydroxylase domain-containing protein [Streptomyces sp. NPDC001795]|uniref:aspartyl/asparaginyl beta-hydroxylase domain-containing protein n=1 Tax=Streptomyces sp. NPDC001795 TaxID=3154525 RepID=UPI003317F68A